MIAIFITDWCVPYDQVVRSSLTFETAEEAVSFINAESRKWWDANDGDRCVEEDPQTEPYKPIVELGYDTARYELWGGEQGFHAMLMHMDYAQLHEDHYKRNYDDKGLTRPGYILVSELGGHKPS